jgi:hypothetical protein
VAGPTAQLIIVAPFAQAFSMTSKAVTRLMIEGDHDRMPYLDENEGCGVAPAISWAINRIEVPTKKDDAFRFLEAPARMCRVGLAIVDKGVGTEFGKPREK